VPKFIFYLLLLGLSLPLQANSRYPLADKQQTARFEQLLKDFRCLVCQNQDLADSEAGLAKDLRQQIYVMVREGKDTAEIRQYLTARYGNFILFKPPFMATTWLLWLGPGLFLLLGLLLFRRLARRGLAS